MFRFFVLPCFDLGLTVPMCRKHPLLAIIMRYGYVCCFKTKISDCEILKVYSSVQLYTCALLL